MKNLIINQAFVSIFASGNSLLEMTKEEFDFIKQKSFVITTNYAPIRYVGHMNCWSDKNASIFLGTHYEQHPKDCLFLSRDAAFLPEMKLREKVDHWFHNQTDRLNGNFTASWVLQLVKKYFPDKTILLFGFDFYNNNPQINKWYDQFTDFDVVKRGKQYDIYHKLVSYKYQLENLAIQKDHIYNCNPLSALETFEKKRWWEILPFNLLHLCSSPLAGAPLHLSNAINKYSNSVSKAILKKGFNKDSKYGNLAWDYDIINPVQSDLMIAIDNADIIHHHARLYSGISENKKEILQYHTPASNYLPEKTDYRFNDRKMVIAQYHPRFYTDAEIVPNIIDIWDEKYLPGNKGEVIKIFYSWASEIKGGWSDKGSEQTIGILERIKNQYTDKVEILIYNNKPHSICMEAKKTCHICIDECVTGSYHLQSLEGCSIAALTFNNLDDITFGYLQKVSGASDHPFEKCSIQQLYDRLCYYIEHTDELLERGKKSREWMEKYWNPVNLVKIFLYQYYKLIAFNSLDQPSIQELATEEKQDERLKSADLQESNKISPFRNYSITTTKNRRLGSNHSYTLAYNDNKEFVPDNGKVVVELYKAFNGETIYIFGTGPSLFKINPEDFKDKLCFSINHAFEVMPHMDYYFTDIYEIYQSIRGVIDVQKMILPEDMAYNNVLRSELLNDVQRIKTRDENAFIYPIQNPIEKNILAKHANLDKNTRFFTWSTVTHSAIHFAAYTGAKKICLIGMDYKDFPDGKVHFSSRFNPLYSLQNWRMYGKHQEGDLWLKEKLFHQGVNVLNLSNSFK